MRRDPLEAPCLLRFFASRERAVCLLLESEDERSLGCRRAAAAAVARAAASSAPLLLAASALLSALEPGGDVILVK